MKKLILFLIILLSIVSVANADITTYYFAFNNASNEGFIKYNTGTSFRNANFSANDYRSNSTSGTAFYRNPINAVFPINISFDFPLMTMSGTYGGRVGLGNKNTTSDTGQGTGNDIQFDLFGSSTFRIGLFSNATTIQSSVISGLAVPTRVSAYMLQNGSIYFYSSNGNKNASYSFPFAFDTTYTNLYLYSASSNIRFDNISITMGSCVPDWSCNGYDVCLSNSTQNCNSVTDLNFCGETYSGDYSEFPPQSCTYVAPVVVWTPAHTSADIPFVVVDFLVEFGLQMIVFVGIISLIVLYIVLVKRGIFK